MSKTRLTVRKRKLEEWMTSVLGDPVTIYLWNEPKVHGVRVAEISALHGNGGYSWMQADDEAALVIFLTERALVEWDQKSDRKEDLSRLAHALVI